MWIKKSNKKYILSHWVGAYTALEFQPLGNPTGHNSPFTPLRNLPRCNSDIPKRIENRHSEKYLHTHIHSSIIQNQKVEATQTLIHDWMRDNKMWFVIWWNVTHPYKGMRGWSTLHTPWRNPDNITLSDRSQTQKAYVVWLHLHELSRFIGAESQLVWPGAREKENERDCQWAQGFL